MGHPEHALVSDGMERLRISSSARSVEFEMGVFLNAFLSFAKRIEGVRQWSAAAGSESNAAKSCQCWSDVSGRGRFVIFSGANSRAHQNYRDALIVVIRSAVRRAAAAGLPDRRIIPNPVWF